MQALILAAGYGTRLLPFTKTTPKALFTIGNKTILDLTIKKLRDNGFKDIAINTHYLSEQIDAFIKKYPFEITVKFEEKKLETAGAIKNFEDFFKDAPFLVINCDILHDINLRKLYKLHKKEKSMATLVFYDYPPLNNVFIDKDFFITSFDKKDKYHKKLCFTGIQILEPSILKFIPKNQKYDLKSLYSKLIKNNIKIKAYFAKNNYWIDMGKKESYKKAIIDNFIRKNFGKKSYTVENLQGDGSDRLWHRIKVAKKTFILSDSSISKDFEKSEFSSFIKIGKSLYRQGHNIPKILEYDKFSQTAFLEDLGSTHLQNLMETTEKKETIIKCYKQVIKQLIALFFDTKDMPSSSFYIQKAYNKKFIKEYECNYFLNEFLNAYLNLNIKEDELKEEFDFIINKALSFKIKGFMHRDMQSRNIMFNQNKFFFIDFQGAKKGLFQYDLASLLIDPYVDLEEDIQNVLLKYAFLLFSKRCKISKADFMICYENSALLRNMQMLGAFSFLSRKKKKKYFEDYIPIALRNLRMRLKKNNSKGILKVLS